MEVLPWLTFCTVLGGVNNFPQSKHIITAHFIAYMLILLMLLNQLKMLRSQ